MNLPNAESDRRVTFFICGMQKSGTTAIASLLGSHPEILMATRKELHYFDQDQPEGEKPPYARLHAQFDWPAQQRKAVGEATPIYSYWPDSLERIARYNPAARIILSLRHPSFRAYAHWKMETARGYESLGFEDAIGTLGRKRVSDVPRGVHRVYSYVERGLYAGQVSRCFRIFGRSNVLVLRTDQFWSEFDREAARLFRFLDVRAMTPVARPGYLSPTQTPASQIPRHGRDALMRIYRDDIVATQALTGMALEDWLDAGYVEPMTRPDPSVALAPGRARPAQNLDR